LGAAAAQHVQYWSIDRFAAQAIAAAESALYLAARPAKQSEAGEIDTPSVFVIQTCFPDYRVPVFMALDETFGGHFRLFTGKMYFTSDVKVTGDYFEWHRTLTNHFFFGNRILWQAGAVTAGCGADIAILELNPRVLSTWLVIVLRSLCGMPTILWGHLWNRQGAGSVRNVLRLLMVRLADGVIAYNKTQAAELKRVLPAQRAVAAPNSLLRAADCSSDLPGHLDAPIILYVGRLTPEKKPILLLEAFSRARPSLDKDVQLYIVGAGKEEGILQRRIGEFGFREHVKLLGHVNNAEVLRSLYGRAICAVSPGYVGLNAIQAFAFGVPLITSRNDPHAPEIEACIDGFNCLYFESDNPDDLASKITSIWQARELWRNRRREISNWTAANYTVETMAGGFKAIVDEIKASSSYGS
jgi:glycosyltransferase involved in cell wall biosynthesis